MVNIHENKPSLTMILGSGFSSEAGLPTTKDLVKHFLKTSDFGVLGRDIEERITCILKNYWQYVFGYTSGDPPDLEDHFTVLDLAANAGHQLGCRYSPKKLRAIRRMSIHRIFQLLDLKYKESNKIRTLFKEIIEYFNVSIVTLNWDIVAEKHIEAGEHIPQGVNYGIDIESLENCGRPISSDGILILKVHGSSDWVYCDCCRKIFTSTSTGKSALHHKVFLEEDDFNLFENLERDLAEKLRRDNRKCRYCDNILTGRIATFSYRKNFSISQFQTIWERAYSVLCNSDVWLFIGYSMPEADFEFRHLLKSAQLARKKQHDWKCVAIIKNNCIATERYRRFFGIENVYQEGLSNWVDNELANFCQEEGNYDP